MGSIGQARKVSTQSLKSEKSDEETQLGDHLPDEEFCNLLGDDLTQDPDPVEVDDHDYSSHMPWIKVNKQTAPKCFGLK